MFRVTKPQSQTRTLAVLATAGLAAAAVATAALAQGKTHEVSIKISHVKALDRIDGGFAGGADFFARVTIGGETINTKPVKGANEVKPDWVIVKSVPAGKVDVKLQILDKDPLKPDDKVDINRLPNKRDLDFTIDTNRCRVEGFASTYRCRSEIKRGGDERKKAEITFNVDVKR
jgi:hypothetical protein